MESSSKVTAWISRADRLTTQLARQSSSSIETVLFLRAARECASEISSFLMSAQHSQPTSASSDKGEVRFGDILRLQQAKNTLVHAINTAAVAQQHNVASSISRIHTKRQPPGAEDTDDIVARNNRASDEELQTLMRVRGLLAVENMKMDTVIASISEGSVALQALHARLEEVDETLTFTQSIVKGMLRVKTIDDLILRVTWILFFAVVCFVWSQRIFGFGAVTVL
ncbi:transmembrane protein, putative [Bodo saltans]|uniref:Transmembrane protein, putative n=1 Tax=Bodo saltans TaxID=75058 RepID=A0A0S4IQ15_BODSA|nr:transmembrane protein, putative [Bodo saltans]|eukprot:CUF91880.1 transmembrane protein, putative [Bodo saltans]